MNSIKKIFSVALAASMVLSMAACGKDDSLAPVDSSNPAESSKASVSSNANDSSEEEAPVKKGPTTYLAFGGKLKVWNPHEAQVSTDMNVFSYTSTSLYDFVPNEAHDNFEIVPLGAASMPVDVTSEYAGNETYGVPADAKEKYAYKVQLRQDLCWEDGTPIKAQDFVDSQQRLLDPKMKNYRASDRYTGNVSFANSKNYFYDGQPDSEGKPTKKVTWDEVGIKATGDYEITVILERPCSAFYFCYNNSLNVVKTDMYDKLKEDSGDIVKTKYGTSVENYMSYGPFKLVSYQEDKMYKFEKNEKWFGWTAEDIHPNSLPDYDNMECQIVDEHATQLQLFLQGKTDYVSLNSDDMKKYGSSDYVVLEPATSTWKFTFNTDFDKLKSMEQSGECRTMPSYLNFRKAFSRALDRKAYCQENTGCSIPGFGLFNRLYSADPEIGLLYRDTERAKQTLLNVYGGDDANAITGYNMEEARGLFQKAYEEAKAAGTYKDGDKVKIECLMFTDGETHQKIVRFVENTLKAATEGTGFEGKCEATLITDKAYYDRIHSGNFTMAMTAWQGAAQNPYALCTGYCYEGTLLEYGFKPNEEMLKGTVNGKEYEKTYRDWVDAILEGEWAGEPQTVRAEALAVMEEGILNQYRAIPIYYTMGGTLLSHRTSYELDEYVNELVGYGKTLFSMDDATWAEHITAAGGTLEY